MNEWLLKYAEFIPLLCISAVGKPRLNTARLTELLVLIIGVSLVTYVMVREVRIELNQTNDRVMEVKRTVEKIYDDLYKPTLPREH